MRDFIKPKNESVKHIHIMLGSVIAMWASHALADDTKGQTPKLETVQTQMALSFEGVLPTVEVKMALNFEGVRTETFKYTEYTCLHVDGPDLDPPAGANECFAQVHAKTGVCEVTYVNGQPNFNKTSEYDPQNITGIVGPVGINGKASPRGPGASAGSGCAWYVGRNRPGSERPALCDQFAVDFEANYTVAIASGRLTKPKPCSSSLGSWDGLE